MVAVKEELAARLAELRQKNPHAYPRDYAALLGTTEAELTPVFYPERAFELLDLEATFAALAKLPRVKLMARTAFAVFELFTRVDDGRQAGALVLKSDSCFVALNTAALGRVYFLAPAAEKEKAAFLVFDKNGAAALKIYIEPDGFDTALLKMPAARVTSADVVALLEGVRAGSVPMTVDTPRQLIEAAAAQKLPLGFELATDAIAVYIKHTPVKIADARGWFNILDENFNLHLKEEAILNIETGAAMRLIGEAGETIKLWSLR